MADKTTNYNLTKPSKEDFYDVNVQNGNMDIIDEQLKILEDGLEHITSKTVTKGNYLVGNGTEDMVEKTPDEVRKDIGAEYIGESSETVDVTVTNGSTQTHELEADGILQVFVDENAVEYTITFATDPDMENPVSIWNGAASLTLNETLTDNSITIKLADYDYGIGYFIIQTTPENTVTVTNVPNISAEVKDNSVGYSKLDDNVKTILGGVGTVETYELEPDTSVTITVDEDVAEYIITFAKTPNGGTPVELYSADGDYAAGRVKDNTATVTLSDYDFDVARIDVWDTGQTNIVTVIALKSVDSSRLNITTDITNYANFTIDELADFDYYIGIKGNKKVILNKFSYDSSALELSLVGRIERDMLTTDNIMEYEKYVVKYYEDDGVQCDCTGAVLNPANGSVSTSSFTFDKVYGVKVTP